MPLAHKRMSSLINHQKRCCLQGYKLKDQKIVEAECYARLTTFKVALATSLSLATKDTDSVMGANDNISLKDLPSMLVLADILHKRLEKPNMFSGFDDSHHDFLKTHNDLMLSQLSPIVYCDKQNAYYEFDSVFCSYLYPTDDEKQLLRNFCHRNEVIKQTLLLLDDTNCCIAIYGVCNHNSLIPTTAKKCPNFYDCYRTIVHKAVPMGFCVIGNSPHPKAPVGGLANVWVIMDSLYQFFQESKAYKAFADNLRKQANLEIKGDFDNMVYLAWELEQDITSSDTLNHLKDGYNIPIDDELINKVKAFESQIENR